MPFVKIIKTKAYFKRFQVKYRRRREGKTDYHARRKLILQDKTKYNSPRYRFVVRFTNKDVVCQIVYASLTNDNVLCAAYSHELTRYGIPVGLTNYAAAYATGLLLARRALSKIGLAKTYKGVEEADGEYFIQEEEEDSRRPFYAVLDVGLSATTTGAKVFAAMKGGVDGGIEIPHSTKRFAGYDAEEENFDPEVLRKYIFGGHVANYMRELEEEDAEKFKKQFSRFIKNEITADNMEEMYKKAHAAIRANPSAVKAKAYEGKPKSFRKQKKNLKQRNHRIQQILASAASK